MIKIGAITIGQAPRTDVTGDMMHLLGDQVELIQAGGLDGLTKADIAAFAPQEGDYILVSRLQDGSSVKFAERYILPRLQECIHKLESQGVRLIMFLCTGDFPDVFTASVPLIFPCHILNGLVPALSSHSNIAVLTPDAQQVAQSEYKWKQYVKQVKAIPASPYGDPAELEQAAQLVLETGADLVVMDCIGYTLEMKQKLAAATGKNIILSRTILARAVGELLEF